MARVLAAAGVVSAGPVRVKRERLEPWHLWPECVPVWNFWAGLRTQWRRGGMDGSPTGLDYAAVWAVLDHSTIHPRRRAWVFDVVRGMEAAALEAWSERAER